MRADDRSEPGGGHDVLAGPPGGYAGFLSRAAAQWPDRPALHFEGSSWTYAELEDWVGAVAGGLSAAGVTGRVALLADNAAEHLVAQFALARIGASFATPNASWTESELRPTLSLLQAETLVGAARFAHLAPRFIDIAALPAAAPVAPAPDQPGREAYLPFSSGTTGAPKAVVHTCASLCAGVLQLIDSLALTDSDRLQLALPLCHVFGATMSAAAIAAGAELTLFARMDLDVCLRHLRETGVSIMPIGGTVAYALAARADLGPLPSLRLFMWGGSAVPPGLAAAITARTGVGFLCSYGMTEAMMVAFNPVERPGDWRLDSPGYPTAGTTVRLSESGELEVRGPSVARGYLGDSAGFSADGWFRTGDLGRVDDEGRLHILDRVKDMLKVSGFAVSPVEVEQAIGELAGVRDCAVFGVPDDRLGEALVAVIVGDVDEASLRDWARGRLATYKQPRHYRYAEALPRTASGKLLRRELASAHHNDSQRNDSQRNDAQRKENSELMNR